MQTTPPHLRCGKCGRALPPGEGRRHQGSVLCEDCFIRAVHSNVGRPHYAHDSAGFMRRLKSTYSVIRQEID